MNSSLLTSDGVTHVKIGLTAVLATALVIAVGICAKPDNTRSDAAVQAVPFVISVVPHAAAPQIR